MTKSFLSWSDGECGDLILSYGMDWGKICGVLCLSLFSTKQGGWLLDTCVSAYLFGVGWCVVDGWVPIKVVLTGLCLRGLIKNLPVFQGGVRG